MSNELPGAEEVSVEDTARIEMHRAGEVLVEYRQEKEVLMEVVLLTEQPKEVPVERAKISAAASACEHEQCLRGGVRLGGPPSGNLGILAGSENEEHEKMENVFPVLEIYTINFEICSVIL
jgi:hypothetical protein